MDAHESCGDCVSFHRVCLFPGASTARRTACARRLAPRGRQGQLNQEGATSETRTLIITFVYTVLNDGRQLNDPLLHMCASFLHRFLRIRTPYALHANTAGHMGSSRISPWRISTSRCSILSSVCQFFFFLRSSVVELNLGAMP